MSEVLAHVMRGKEIESIHRGDIVVVNKDYGIVYAVGNPEKRTYWRSAAKPFQVLPMIEAGGVEEFGFGDADIAIMASSHGGEERHVKKVQCVLSKMGYKEEILDCGAAAPMYYPAAKKLLKEGKVFKAIHNACSGKHSSMIALALLKGYEVKGYINSDHPVQREMLDVVADVTGMAKASIGLGVDGCGVSVFELPVYNMAVAYSKLALARDVKTSAREEAISKVAEAMAKNPYYVAGSERLDTLLIETTKGRLVAKLGAEGVYCIGVMNEGIGIALKIEDGNTRPIDAIVLKLLKSLDLITPSEHEELRRNCMKGIKNHRGEIIGEIRAAF